VLAILSLSSGKRDRRDEPSAAAFIHHVDFPELWTMLMLQNDTQTIQHPMLREITAPTVSDIG